eukprot:12890010-Prorocentrum_lima.AAC.1
MSPRPACPSQGFREDNHGSRGWVGGTLRRNQGPNLTRPTHCHVRPEQTNKAQVDPNATATIKRPPQDN